MEDRFKDAQWYIGGDPLSATIFDASDPDGPGHAVVCRHAVIEDARLIAAAPMLLQAAKALLQRGPVGIESECHWCGREGEDTEHCSSDDCMGTLARAAIAKAEGRISMPKFTVKATRAYYSTVVYEVEADSEDEARDRVKFDGPTEVSFSSPDWDGDEEIFDVIEHN